CKVLINMSFQRIRLGRREMGNSIRILGLASIAILVSLFAPKAFAAPNLAAPGSPTATAVSTSQVNLSWIDTNSGKTGYSIERSLSSTTGFAVITTTAANATSYQNGGLASATTYYYRIRAVWLGNTSYSLYSNVVSARTFSPAPTPTPTATRTPTLA